MKKFTVIERVTLFRVTIVEADSAEEAQQKVANGDYPHADEEAKIELVGVLEGRE